MRLEFETGVLLAPRQLLCPAMATSDIARLACSAAAPDTELDTRVAPMDDVSRMAEDTGSACSRTDSSTGSVLLPAVAVVFIGVLVGAAVEVAIAVVDVVVVGAVEVVAVTVVDTAGVVEVVVAVGLDDTAAVVVDVVVVVAGGTVDVVGGE